MTQIVSLRPSVCRTTATTTKGGMRWSKEEERDAQMEDKATVCLRELSTVLHWFHLSMSNRFSDSCDSSHSNRLVKLHKSYCGNRIVVVVCVPSSVPLIRVIKFYLIPLRRCCRRRRR